MKKKLFNRSFFIKAVFSVAFFSVLFSFVNGNELLAMLKNINWLYFTLSFLLVPVMLFTSTFKWKSILDVHGGNVPFMTLIRIYLVGYFFSNLFPSVVGGDVVRSFYSGKLIDNQAYSAVSVFVERFSGILFLIILVIFAPLLQPQLYSSPYIFIPALAAFVLLVVVTWVWSVKNPLQLPDKIATAVIAFLKRGAERTGISFLMKFTDLVSRIYAGLFRRLQKFHNELNRSVKAICKDKILFIKLVIITIFFYVLTWTNVYVSFRAFNVHPGFLTVCALVPTIMFVGHLPVTLLGNLGFFESVFVFYFFQINILPAESLAMGLLLRLKMLCLGFVGYLVYLSYKYSRSSELEQLEKFAATREEQETGNAL